mmetsp:Transcript_33219/g.71866  ORF Transcript_33219/g.71866 Transcript_33219/m.71866 type:complete len:223 (+) Transcript_33219:388-1056(+)
MSTVPTSSTPAASAPAPVAAPAAAPAPAPAATAAAVTTATTTQQAEAAKNEKLFPEPTTAATAESTKAATTTDPPPKKRKVQLRIDQDPSLKPILQCVVGTRANKFRDGLIGEDTAAELKTLWSRLDFVQDGVLKQIHFQSVRGIDPMWEQLLDACDVDGDGSITPTEFLAGFVVEALNKPLTMPAGGATVSGFEVLKALQVVLNQHLVDEARVIKKKMGWS